MTVREYIGARYVPLFMGEWDDTVSYEPLSIVEYEGDSYTSKQAVPIGIAITNTSYWALTGNYNAQIEQYRTEVQGVVEDISDVENVLPISDFSSSSTVKDAIDAVGATLPISDFSSDSTVKDALDELSGDISDIEDVLPISDFSSESTVKDAIDLLSGNLTIEPMYIKMFDGSGTNNTTCKIVQCDDANILIDTGALVDAQNILNWLSVNDVDKLDALVITHYHEDHYENYESIIRNKCDSNTKIFVQMAPTSSNGQYTYYVTYSGNVENLLTSLGYSSITPTEEGTEYTFGTNNKLKMYVYNVTRSNRTAYDSSWGQGGTTYYPGAENAGKSTLNNYSLVTRFECDGASYVDTGDVEGEAQKKLAGYMKPCTVALNPHHFYNNMGYEEFYDRLMPQMWLVSNHFAVQQGEPAYTSLDTHRFNSCYLGRYVKFNFDKVNIITNMDGNVDISLMRNNVINFNGYIVDQDYNTGGTTVPHYACMLPPSVYNDNPYIIIDDAFTLEYLDNVVRKYYNFAATPIGFYIPTSSSGNTYGANSSFANAVRALWEPMTVNSEIFMWLDNTMHWNFEFSTVQSPCNSLKIFAPTGNIPANVSWNYNVKGKLNAAIEGVFSDGDNLPTNDPLYNYLMRSNIIGVKTTSGVRIPCIRESEYNSTSQRSYFQGTVIDTTGAYLINVFIYENSEIHIKRITLSNGTVDTSTLKIGKLWIIS